MSAVHFEREEVIRFAHCDPAGIVFYPRYFEMLNALIEDWLAEGLGCSFSGLIGQRGLGLPTVHLKTDFKLASRMGERLSKRLSIVKLGRTSLQLGIEFHAADGLRVAFEQVLVCTSQGASHPIPPDIRAAIERTLGATT